MLQPSPMTTPKFSFAGIYKDAKVIKVVDGDTVQLAIPFAIPPACINIQEFAFSVRLKGINCPETRTKNDEEKRKGMAAKAFTADLLSDKTVTLDCCGQDKYGRLLGRIFIEGKDVSETILQAGHAIKYMDD